MGTSIFGNGGYNGATISDGLACTTANTGATTVINFSGSTVKWKASTGFGGTYILEAINASGQAASLRLPFDASSYSIGGAADFTCPALPPSGAWLTLATFRAGSTAVGLVQIDNSGKLQVSVGGSYLPTATTPSSGTPAALAAGAKYRVEVTAAGSSGSATGTVSARIFTFGEATTTNYLAGTTSASAATGTTAFTHMDWGIGAHATVFTYDFTNIRLVSGSASWIGPYVATTPAFDFSYTITPSTINGGDTVTIAATRISGTGSGTTMTMDVDWGDGTSTPAQASPATHVYNPNASTDFPVQVGATLS